MWHASWTRLLTTCTDVEDSPPCPLPTPCGALSIAFHATESDVALPPAFYVSKVQTERTLFLTTHLQPGQSIPTVLTFLLPRGASLPHALRPQLTLSLVGTLRVRDAAPRVIIDISVSLSEGLALWARDAGAAARRAAARLPGADTHSVANASPNALPPGTYTLPLSAQVPSTPRLPPTFNGDGFALSYALCVNLTCDEADSGGTGTRGRLVVAHAARPFDLLPTTLPTRAPRMIPHSFWVPTTSAGGETARWVIHPRIPTTAYSPTSVIPIELTITPPQTEDDGAIDGLADDDTAVLVRVSLVREELVEAGTTSSTCTVVSTRIGWERVGPNRQPVTIRPTLPLNVGSTWRYGFTTVLAIDGGPDAHPVNVSSKFHLHIDSVFLPASAPRQLGFGGPGLRPPVGGSDAQSRAWARIERRAPSTSCSLSIPIVVGSVSEPRDAMHAHRWSDLQLDEQGDGGTMIDGEAFSCEDGWLSAPPSYAEAIDVVPYVY